MATFRQASDGDRTAVIEAICSSFDQDPLWSWLFADDERRQAQYTAWWAPFVDGALRFPWLRVSDGCEAVALWIPPNESELTPEAEAGMLDLLDHLGIDTQRAETVFDRFEDARHGHEPHYYLSILGTHSQHRGQGLGMALLAENLAEIDALHQPAYLESTNDGNLPRYERVGFRKAGSFEAADGGPVVTTMWREAR